MSDRIVTVANVSKGSTVCSHARVANTVWSRFVGLLSERSISLESGLLLLPSSGVHTFGMRFAIDLVALDRNLFVTGVWESVGPWKVRAVSPGTHSVLELHSGRAKFCGVAVGDQFAIHTAAQAA